MASNNGIDTTTGNNGIAIAPPQLLPPIDNTEAMLLSILIEMRRMNATLGSILANVQTQTAVKAVQMQEATKALPNQSKRR